MWPWPYSMTLLSKRLSSTTSQLLHSDIIWCVQQNYTSLGYNYSQLTYNTLLILEQGFAHN